MQSLRAREGAMKGWRSRPARILLVRVPQASLKAHGVQCAR